MTEDIPVLEKDPDAEPEDYKGTGSVFEDVNQNSWRTESIDFCVYKGYVKGVTGITLRPDDNLTRAQAAKIIMAFAAITGKYDN